MDEILQSAPWCLTRAVRRLLLHMDLGQGDRCEVPAHQSTGHNEPIVPPRLSCNFMRDIEVLKICVRREFTDHANHGKVFFT